MLIALIGLLGASTVAVVAFATGPAGVGYLAIYALALVPGLPLGFAVFGRRHALGWIVGAALGYFLTALAIWTVIAAHAASARAFVTAWALTTLVTWLASRALGDARLSVQPWTARDMRALLLVLLLVPAIAGPPFAKVGATDSEGNRYYRAYFTADFVWHAALTSELSRFSMPPRNPYLANRPIHYYWTYFLLPGAVSGAGPAALRNVETCLKVNAVGTALLFVSAMFLAAWTAVPRPRAVAAGVGLAIVASSAEGLYALWRFWDRGVPLSAVRDLNIDALSNWWLSGLRVDGLQRCFWWVPQHSMAYALGLVALAVSNGAAGGAPAAAGALAGIALGGAVLMNPFVGGIFSLVFGLAAALDAFRSADPFRRILRSSIAVVPVVAALGWCAANEMIEGGAGALQFGWLGDARHAPAATLFLSLGPALVAAAIGLAARTEPTRALPCRTGAAALLAGISLVLLYFVRLNVDASWVGFRAGQLFLVAVPALIARGFIARRGWRDVAIGVASVALVAGLPTTLIDTYNARDITNFSESPIGPWTVTVTKSEREALDWIHRATPPDAIVQMDPTARGRQTWSLIPSFAGRRMAAGLPISLLDTVEYHDKAERVTTMYATADPAEAWNIAHSLRIDYIYVDRVERTAYPEGIAKFDRAPQYFPPAFRNSEVTVYQVQ